MKKLLLILCLCAPAWATTTVTGNLKTLGTGTVSLGTFVRFYLRGCSGNQPRINGTALIAPTLGNIYYVDFVPNVVGLISGTIYSTTDATGLLNGEIECGGLKSGTWYGMVPFFNGKAGPETPIAAKNTAVIDISNVTPLTANPIVVSPTGDLTYARLDAGNMPFTGAVTGPSFGSVLYVGPGGYSTVAAAVTAAGTNRTMIIIEPTATDLTCPAASTNLLVYDLRGTAGGCANNTIGVNDNTTIVNAMMKEQMTVGTIPNNGSAVSHWFLTILNNGTPPSASTILDGTSPECLVTGTLTGTLGLCDASEGAAGVFSTGGTVSLVEGGQGYVADIVGRTTAITNARGLDGIGCNGILGTPKPVNCTGLYARAQGTQASGRNYANVWEANMLSIYDGVTLSKWKWDVEDNTHTIFPFIFLDGADNQIHVQAVNANGLQIADSAAAAHLKITSTGISLGNSIASPTAAVDAYGDLKLEANNRFAPVEGTCSAGIANFDMVCANAADHALTLSNNAGAYGHVLATGSLDAKGLQTKRGVAGCTTGGAAGNSCGTDITVTWTTPFADANYTVSCIGNTPTNVPSAPFIVSATKLAATVHINYFAITAAAASYATIECTAVHD